MVLPVHAGVAEVAGVATLVPYRRRGHGRLVTAALVATAYRMGADLVMLGTDDPGARRLYLAMGFAPPRG
jgi:GNAT superfamily N-acetyltransferase